MAPRSFSPALNRGSRLSLPEYRVGHDNTDNDDPLAKEPLLIIENPILGEPTIERITFRRSGFWRRLLSFMALRQRRSGRTGWGNNAREKIEEQVVGPRHSRSACSVYLTIMIVVLALYGIINLFLVMFGVLVMRDGNEKFLPHWGEPGQIGQGLSRYATDFTRDIEPIPCHSHNDYTRRVPLYEAIHYGFTSVEADVWLHDNELYIGHKKPSLTESRTFRSLYVDPIVRILDHQNPSNKFSRSTRYGVFDADPEQTLVLLVDIKTSGYQTFAVVQEQLEALRAKKYLTYFNGKTVVSGPVTVVATGATPFDLLISNTTYRDIFFDAPLDRIWEDGENGRRAEASKPDAKNSDWGWTESREGGQGHEGIENISSAAVFTPENSYYASVSFEQIVGWVQLRPLDKRQIDLIRRQVRAVHNQGLKVRYWNTPNWPVGLRNHVWRILVQEGVDMLNADQLEAVASGDWREGQNWWVL